MKELVAKNDRRTKAEQQLIDMRDEASRLQENEARTEATQEVAAKALRTTIKSTAKLVDGEGKTALADRQATTAMLAKLRIAEAHADGSIVGLSDEQKKDMDMKLMHSAIETAVGTPTDTNVDLAEKQLKSTAKATHEKHQKTITQLGKDYHAKLAHELKEKEDRGREEKAKKELKSKKSAEKSGKKVENINEHMELPAKAIKEGFTKKANDLTRANWFKHEQRVTDELAVKGRLKTEAMIANEQSDKKKAAAIEIETKKVCKGLIAKKVSALEKRSKAISAFSQARKALIRAQQKLNGQKTKIEEEASYQNKGNECQTQSKYNVGARKNTSVDGCKKECTNAGKKCHAFNAWQGHCQLLRHGAIGDHLECPNNPVTGERECPNKLQDCHIYQKVTGPGSEEAEEETQFELSLGDSLKDNAQVGYGNPFKAARNAISKAWNEKKNKEKSNKARARAAAARARALAAEKSGKERNRKTAMKNEEKNRKAAVAKANANAKAAEGANKKAKQAKLLADEKSNKDGLKEAERQVRNKQTKMRERNLKAADADTQARKCEGNLLRRRRTCACDDAPKRESQLTNEALLEEEEQSSTTWERRRYVRRRYVEPSSAARRRRMNFPAPPPPARLPGAVCPCCPPPASGVARSRTCQLADAKEKNEKAAMKGTRL